MRQPGIDRKKYVIGDASDHVGFLNCERIAERSHIHGWTVEQHFHEGLAQLFVFGHGTVRSQIDTQRKEIVGPALVWMPEMVTHAFEYPLDMPGWVITVPSADVSRIAMEMTWLNGWIGSPRVISGQQANKFIEVCVTFSELALKEVRRQGETTSIALESLFRLLITNCHRALITEEALLPLLENRRLNLVTRFQMLLDQHLEDPKTVSEYSRILAVTPTHLSRSAKEITGKTAGELIADRVLLEAKRKLVFTNLSISEICYALRFSSPAYFSRFFTKLTNDSPTAYRKRKQDEMFKVPVTHMS